MAWGEIETAIQINPVAKGKEQTEELPFCNHAEEKKVKRGCNRQHPSHRKSEREDLTEALQC
jgi:hypothetical protein